MKVPIDKIYIKDRIREDIGEITPLVESMSKFGLLNPVTISEDYELLAGYRRLETAKILGWKTIECHFVLAETKLAKFEIEMEENTTRKEFTEHEIEKSNKIRKELTAKGLKKFLIWMKKFWKWLKSLFIKND